MTWGPYIEHFAWIGLESKSGECVDSWRRGDVYLGSRAVRSTLRPCDNPHCHCTGIVTKIYYEPSDEVLPSDIGPVWVWKETNEGDEA